MLRIEGYAIVSADGMLADASGVMPATLKFDADQRFFESALELADLIVHGRNSFEDQPHSALRRRLVVTRRIPALAPDPGNPKATLWNPAGASFADACAAAGVVAGSAAIIGGGDVFGMFLDRYDTFWLSRASHVRLPGGVPVFPGVPAQSPAHILAAHGLRAEPPRVLDEAGGVTLTAWQRA
ncbi:MAG: dihydrofolate reductase [Xanthobacteraceae bacterium]|nr:MAG: dihydrofolate reductase [Xanthobacteraceae bacterium]